MKNFLKIVTDIIAALAVIAVAIGFVWVLNFVATHDVEYDPCNVHVQYATLQQVKDCGL